MLEEETILLPSGHSVCNRDMKPWFAYMLLAGCVAVSACDDEEDLCDAKCECEGCSSWEYDDCVYDYEATARDAEYWGCPDFYDDWVDCRQDTYFCRGTDFEDSCGHYRERLNDCIRR